jgi:hypothetical protein
VASLIIDGNLLKPLLADHGPAITDLIKPVMGEDYNYDPTPALWALWRSYIGCEYVDDIGGTVFYRNRHGKAVRETGDVGSLVVAPEKL